MATLGITSPAPPYHQSIKKRRMETVLTDDFPLQEAGKYLFPDEASQTALDDNWEHTQLRVVRGKVSRVQVKYRQPF
jgi:hypothetical protein